MITVTICTI